MKPSIARKIVKSRQEFLRARKKRTPKLQLLRTIAFSPHPATAVQPKYAPGTPREKRRSPEFPPATPRRTSLRPNTRNLTSNGEACSCKEVLKKVESLMIHTHSLCHTHTHTYTHTQQRQLHGAETAPWGVGIRSADTRSAVKEGREPTPSQSEQPSRGDQTL